MALDLLKFLLGKRSRLVQDSLVYAELAYIMEQPCRNKLFTAFLVPAQPFSHQCSQNSHMQAMMEKILPRPLHIVNLGNGLGSVCSEIFTDEPHNAFQSGPIHPGFLGQEQHNRSQLLMRSLIALNISLIQDMLSARRIDCLFFLFYVDEKDWTFQQAADILLS